MNVRARKRTAGSSRHSYAHLATLLKIRSADLDLVMTPRGPPEAFDEILILDIPSFNHPRRALTILLGVNDAGVDLAQH